MATPTYIASVKLSQIGYSDGDVDAFNFSSLSPANGDTVVLFVMLRSQGSAATSLVAPSGYTAVDSALMSAVALTGCSLRVFSHVWLTGDTTSPSFTMHGSSVGNVALVFAVLLRPSGGSNPVAVDGTPAHSELASTTGIASSSLTPGSASDLYFVFYGADSTHDGAMTGPPTLTSLQASGLNPGEIDAQLAYGTFSSATGTYTASLGPSYTWAQISVLFNVGGGGGGSGVGKSGLIFNT